MTQLSFLYHIIKVLFVIELILLTVGLFQCAKKRLFIILCIAFIVLIRIPFYAHSDGMVLSSDNAQEALQSFEIRDSKTAPFFLLDSSGHNGTLKYLCVAFIYDMIGTANHYLYFVLFQLVIFLGFLYLIYKIFHSIVDRKLLLIFIMANFAFIEVIFDYSLFLRAAPYLEMLVFIFLGVYLFDFTLKDKSRVFFSCYFFLFSAYIHPLAVFAVVAFFCVVFIQAIRDRSFFKNFALLLGGALAGSCHLIYYQLFYPKPQSRGTWYRTEFLSLSDISLSRVPKILGKVFGDFKTVFENILSFEFNYGTVFFRESQRTESVLIAINKAVVYLSFVVLILGLFFAVKTLVSLKTKNKKELEWIYLFYLFLLGIILGRLLILSPKPFYEPRHNIDLAICVLMSYLFVFSRVYKIKKLVSFKSMILFLLLLAFAYPHAHYYLKAVKLKESSHREILSILNRNGVKYLTTDWVIAYSIYLLSNRTIKVSDSLGPVTIPFFFPKLREQVDRIPETQKAYLFFSDTYPRTESHKKTTRFLKTRILDHLNRQSIARRVIKLDHYTIIIPEPARFLERSR
ncbi:MAG: hypothetical protein PVI66_08920 [Candidatus Aminicenantes bacterium]